MLVILDFGVVHLHSRMLRKQPRGLECWRLAVVVGLCGRIAVGQICFIVCNCQIRIVLWCIYLFIDHMRTYYLRTEIVYFIFIGSLPPGGNPITVNKYSFISRVSYRPYVSNCSSI